MTVRLKQRILIATLLAVVAGVIGSYAYAEYRKIRFLRELCLVGFSTSMVGEPQAEKERVALRRAEELGIDLYAEYRRHLESGPRYDLAWMLISKESTEYIQYASQNVESVPWPEVRIWVARRNEESLSSDCRKKLLELILASPTSEAKLSAARWYREQGRITESEDGYHAAMTQGSFWDAFDAANQLVDSERYHDDAVDHLLWVVRDSEHFSGPAAYSLLNLYGVREELEPLVDSCRNEPKDGLNRKRLVDKLTQLIEQEE